MQMPFINHASVGVVDFPKALSFYDAILAPLGGKQIILMEGLGVGYGTQFPEFWVQLPFNQQEATVGNGVHIALTAPSKEAVEEFHKTALKQGGACDGPPGYRDYSPGYYAAFIRDPEGNKIEAVFFEQGLGG